jgi:hypothetical protein
VAGELALACAIAFFSLYVVSRLAARPIRRAFRLEPLPWYQAAAWALVIVVGVPLCLHYGLPGVALLVGPTLLAVLIRIARRRAAVVDAMVRRLWATALVGLTALVALPVFSSSVEALAHPPPSDAVPTLAEAGLLAWQVRPGLFFDDAEQFVPLDIEDAIAAGRVLACGRGVLGRVDAADPDVSCPQVQSADEVPADADYVLVEQRPLGRGQLAGGRPSALYHHVVRADERTILVDYWWYFAQNPSPVRPKVLCGPMVRWLGPACGEHASDWEGITVVLARCDDDGDDAPRGCITTAGGPYRITAVHYAQHENTIKYSWAQLRKAWDTRAHEEWTDQIPRRPLAFVALNSHASYPLPCTDGCPQTTRALPERRNGKLPWANNDARCSLTVPEPETAQNLTCLKPLPVMPDGAATGWNAFAGHWGAHDCILDGAVCDAREPPRGPAFQSRYENPAGFDLEGTLR